MENENAKWSYIMEFNDLGKVYKCMYCGSCYITDSSTLPPICPHCNNKMYNVNWVFSDIFLTKVEASERYSIVHEYKCPECNNTIKVFVDDGDFYSYCPHCGIKMDGYTFGNPIS